jgi:hypothetical protein
MLQNCSYNFASIFVSAKKNWLPLDRVLRILKQLPTNHPPTHPASKRNR